MAWKFDLLDGLLYNDTSGTGDVVGPSSSTDNAIVRFDGTTGKLIQNYTSGAPTISDTGAITATQGGSLTGTWSDLGTVTTIDINGGTLDGTVIGGASAAAATVTTLSLNNGITFTAGVAVTSTSYQIIRDADATNQLHFNVPAAAGMEWSTGDTARIILSNTFLDLTAVGIILRANNLQLGNLGFYFGASIDTATYVNPFLAQLQTQTNFAFSICVSATTGYMMILKGGNQGGNYAHATTTNPTLSIYSASTSATSTLEFVDFSHNQTNALSHAGKGGFAYTQNAAASGVPIMLLATGAAHTGMTASTEVIGVNFNLSATKQWATGALATQREFLIQAPTYGFVGASTITTASTFTITGAPIAGTNATITTSLALWVQAGAARLDGNFQASARIVEDGTTTSTGAGAVAITGRIHEITTNGIGNALTLADGAEGQRLTVVYVAEGGGTDTAILTPTNLGNGTAVTFNVVGDVADGLFTNGQWYFWVQGAVIT